MEKTPWSHRRGYTVAEGDPGNAFNSRVDYTDDDYDEIVTSTATDTFLVTTQRVHTCADRTGICCSTVAAANVGTGELIGSLRSGWALCRAAPAACCTTALLTLSGSRTPTPQGGMVIEFGTQSAKPFLKPKFHLHLVSKKLTLPDGVVNVDKTMMCTGTSLAVRLKIRDGVCTNGDKGLLTPSL